MATPATSIQWEVLFRRNSLVDFSTYSQLYDYETLSENGVRGLVKRLEQLGYINVTYGLRVTLP